MPYPELPFCHHAVKVGCFASRVGDFAVGVTQIGPFGTFAGFQLPCAEMEGERDTEGETPGSLSLSILCILLYENNIFPLRTLNLESLFCCIFSFSGLL